jgi:hypothetical protein
MEQKPIDIEVPPPPKFVDQPSTAKDANPSKDSNPKGEKARADIILPTGDVETMGTKGPALPIR